MKSCYNIRIMPTTKISPQAFVLIGRSGSGKGTQADLLIKDLKEIDPGREVLYIYSGQEFRKFIQGSSFTAKKSNEYYATGKLQPEFLAVRMWVDVLTEKYNGTDHVIFDGTPRKPHEAGVLDSIFDFYEFKRPIIIDIKITPEETMRRLLARKRQDDNVEDIQKRLNWYETDVVPTIEYYRNNPKYNFMEIDGMRTPEEIHADIVKRMGLV